MSIKALHTAYRVADLDRSVGFYETGGFRLIGRVAIGDGSIFVMRNLAGDGARGLVFPGSAGE